MVASSEIGWLEQVLRGHVARFLPGDQGGGGAEASVREVLTAPELSQDEQGALDEWEEGLHSGRSVGDLLLEARINAAVQVQADAMAKSLGMQETPDVPPVHVARAKEKSSDESLVASLTSAGVIQEVAGALSVTALSSESTFVFTDGEGYEALRRQKLDPNQTDYIQEGREAKLATANKALTVVQSMHGLDAVEECIKQALPKYNELARKEPVELEERDLTGEVLGGKYRVKRALGKGGFGTVYEAVDEMLGAPVAIKVLNPKAAGHDRALEQFLGEAKLLTNLDHPNVVRWITFDKREDGQHYFVMEYLHGEELSEILKREGRLAPERVLHMLGDIIDALRAAHRLPDGSSLLHLDLKPQNVFVVSGELERIKVIDFGISQHIGAEAREAAGVEVMSAPDRPGQDLSATIASQVTPAVASDSKAGVTRARGGTLLYASPEQCKHLAGHSDIVELDGRSDLYSVGVMGFQLLTGDMPFEHLRTPLDAINAHLNVAPRKPSDLKADVPRKLADFIARCLEKDREDRFADAEEAYAALDRIANPPSRWPWIAAAAGLVVVLTALWFVLNKPLDRFDLELELVHVGPAKATIELPIGGLMAKGTEVSFWDDSTGGEQRLLDWRGEVSPSGDILIHAPPSPNELVDELVYLRISGSGKDQWSSEKLRIVFLGQDSWMLGEPGITGLDDRAVDPVDAELEIAVENAEREAIERVEVTLDGEPLGVELDDAHSTGADLFYTVSLDGLSAKERGPATFEVTVRDRAAGVQKSSVELDLIPEKLTVKARLERCPLRGSNYHVNKLVKPLLVVETNREADEAEIELFDAAGKALSLSIPTTKTSEGWELDFSGLNDAVTGSILVKATDAKTTYHERSDRGKAETPLYYEFQPDLPELVEVSSPRAEAFELNGKTGYVTNEDTFELSVRRGGVHLTVEAVCNGERLAKELSLAEKDYGPIEFELPTDGVYDIELNLVRLGVDDAEGPPVETFVVRDRSTRTARLQGPPDAVLTRATESFGVELHLSAPAGAHALPVDVSWEARGGSQTERGSLADLMPSAQPETIQLDPATLADGTYELLVTGEDKAGNALEVPESGYAFTVAREGPKVDPVRPRDGKVWGDHEDNVFRLLVDVSDPNRVDRVSCTVGKGEDERTRPQPLALRAGSDSRWETTVELPPEWANSALQIELTAFDRHGVESTRTILATVESFGLPVHAIIDVELPGAPEVPIGSMRLVEGDSYSFHGTGRRAEKNHFKRANEPFPDYFNKDSNIWARDEDIEAFYLDTNEVTVAEFKAFLRHADGLIDEDRRRWLTDKLEDLADELPVTDVTWYEAVAYAKWVGKRLPTYQEWEYAVRGGVDYRPYSFATGGSSKAANINFNRHEGPWPVSRGDDVTPSDGNGVGGGIRNLCSNVSEWTARFTPLPLDPKGVEGPYLVGASYGDENCFFYKAVSMRPDEHREFLGFRCAQGLLEVQQLMGQSDPPVEMSGK